jgi:hypothetical protein
VRLCLLIALTLGSIATSVCAQTIALPLDGYFRPGAYMPVKKGSGVFSSEKTPDPFLADSVTTDAKAGEVAPVFVLNALTDQLQCGDAKLPLHALAEDDRLVGRATHDDAVISQIFPQSHVINIELNPSNPLPGAAIAWDSLDAAVLESIEPNRIAPLLATGMAIIIRSDARPDTTWPWQRVGDAWVLRPVSTIQPSMSGESAYEPTYAWHPSHSPATRQMIVIIAVLASCAMLGTALWRSRWNIVALGIVAALVCGGVCWWRLTHGTILTMTREDRIISSITQTARWTYQTSPARTQAEMKCDSATWPVFASQAHAESMHCVMECDATGQPVRFRYELPANTRMAFVSVDVGPTATSR